MSASPTLMQRVALAIAARNAGQRMISPGTNATELAHAALSEIAAAWEERWGDQYPGVIAIRHELRSPGAPAEPHAVSP